MKILKTLAVVIGIFVLLNIILKMLQKGVKTRIEFEGIERQKNTATVSVYANDKRVNIYDIPLSVASEQVYAANDYRLKVTQLGNIVIFKVLDDQNRETATKPLDKTNAPYFTIFSE